MENIELKTKIVEKSYNRKLEKWCSNAKINRKTAILSRYLELKVKLLKVLENESK